jgi:hypothetical protein
MTNDFKIFAWMYAGFREISPVAEDQQDSLRKRGNKDGSRPISRVL